MSATYLQHLFSDARAVELRVQLGERWLSGQFDSISALQQAAEAHPGGNLYTTLNRLWGMQISNAMGSNAICDTNVKAIVRLPFDFDPVRPAGVPSTDSEQETAIGKRNKFISMLMGLQWPMPATGLSGNGAHALYRCFLKATPETREMLALVYRGLHSDFSDEQVTFDSSVRNPGRVWRLYGTVNRKGAPSAARPHRLAVVRIPQRWDGVAPKQIEALASRYAKRKLPPKAPDPHPGPRVDGSGDYATLDAPAWFAAHGSLKRALGAGKHAVTCPWCDEHSTKDAPYGTDTVIWEAEPGRWPSFHCSHAHCEGRSIVNVMRLWGDAERILRSCLAEDSGVNVTLRDYQQRMVDAIRALWDAGERRVLGVLPTGGGKTEVAMTLLDEIPEADGRALIVVERKTLCKQWIWRLRRHGVKRYIGVLQGDNTRAVYAPILVATAQTIRARGVPDGIGLAVIDESHIWHKSHDDVLRALGEAKLLGLTATPLREGLGLRFDHVVIGARIRELIAAGHLVRPRYFAPKPEAIEDALRGVAIRAGDFAANELSAAMRGKAIIGDVVSEWLKRGEDRQTIAFCVDKQHARDLAAEFVVADVAAEVVLDDTRDDERAQIFESFENRQVRVLCSVGVLGVGFDMPIAGCAIMARPTLSYSLYLQQGGRVLRPDDGKHDALVLDHAGNTGRFGVLEDFDPPTELSQIDKRTDRRARHESSGVWTCRNCEAINSNAETICEDCGTPRRRHSAVIVVDGELRSIDYADHETLPGPTHDRVRDVYLMLRHYGASKNMRNPEGWAWHAAQRKFAIPADKAKQLIPWHWRGLTTIPPDEETSRWLAADWQRSRVIQRWAQRRNADAAASL